VDGVQGRVPAVPFVPTVELELVAGELVPGATVVPGARLPVVGLVVMLVPLDEVFEGVVDGFVVLEPTVLVVLFVSEPG